MDFSWSPEQLELFAGIERFATRELNHNLRENDRQGLFNWEGWRKCGAMGIQGLPVPPDYGGLGQDPLTTVGALERLGSSCRDNGLVFSLNAQLWTVGMPLVAFGTEEQKRRFLPGLCDGSLIGGNAMTEPDSGSDAYSLRTTAVKEGDRYRLNGSKTFVTNGPIADVVVVFATVDASRGLSGISAFLVEKHFPGFSVAAALDKMGLHTSPTAEMFFDDCLVPEGNRLGREGAGPSIFTHAMTWERGCILSSAVGSMQRILKACIRYTKQRKQFGQPINRFQQVASKIVDMKLRLETSRYLLYHCANQLHLGRTAILEAALAKLHISECWVKCCEDALQIHGGYGYMTEYEIERELRDAIGSRIYSGTNEIQRNVIASLLL
ncbi:MAG: acyl-CoA dehydrogenase family protein [Deltaproteobacteria bacterium]|nr:acyl-CoA dehydrogenase family protein [Deltaproteobacteria bacterium]